MRYVSIATSILSLMVGAGISLGAEYIVDGSGGGDFLTIQAALDSAEDGDIVTVRSGTYTENIDYLGKNLVLQSDEGAASTSIDGSGNGSAVTFRNGETAEAVLRGFTLEGGTGTFYESNVRGGAVFCLAASPTIEDCLFVENSADYAAAVYVEDCTSIIRGCSFIDNVANTYGGAIAGGGSRVEVYQCYFEGNRAIAGDGTIHLALDSPIEDCVFVNNEARAGGAINAGGFGADFQIRRCTFVNNRATITHGGAIRVHEATCLIEECLFLRNFAELDGGALLCIDGGRSTVRHCTFDENGSGRWGGTISLWNGPSPTIENCIVARSSSAGGLSCFGSNPSLACNDFWDNTGGNYTNECPDPTGTDGNISEDPRWCESDVDDYELFGSSPCAPNNSEGCGLIGAFGVGCTDPTPILDRSWGQVKAAYR